MADKSSDLSLDTHGPENHLLWYFHNWWCRLFGHEKNWQSADYRSQYIYFLWKISSFKKLHNQSSKCDNPNDICTYWIENEHHCLIKFDTRNVPEICRRQNNWNQCPTWPRSHQDLSPKIPPFLSILSRKKNMKKIEHNWAKNFMKLDLNSIITYFSKSQNTIRIIKSILSRYIIFLGMHICKIKLLMKFPLHFSILFVANYEFLVQKMK